MTANITKSVSTGDYNWSDGTGKFVLVIPVLLNTCSDLTLFVMGALLRFNEFFLVTAQIVKIPRPPFRLPYLVG